MKKWRKIWIRGAGFGPEVKREGVSFTPVDSFSLCGENDGNGRGSGNGRKCTLVCKLDSKHRLVLPVLVRDRLGLNGSVILSVQGDKIILKKPQRTLGDGGETPSSRPISRNCSEVVE